MFSAIPRPQEILNLNDASELPSSEQEVSHTILAELVPDKEHHQFEAILHLLGYTGDLSSFSDIETFLLSSLQAQRILFHHQSNALTFDTQPDHRLSKHLTRIFLALDNAPQKSQVQDVLTMSSNINLGCTLVKKVIGTRAHKMQQLLTSSDRVATLSPPRRPIIENIFSELRKEHITRIGLLLTRLHVTLTSFSRSERAKTNPQSFYVLFRRFKKLQKEWVVREPITIHQSLFAHTFIIGDVHLRNLAQKKRPLEPVKQFVMGTVPDRGGRISNQAEMPQFQQRLQRPTSHDKGHRDRRDHQESFGKKRRSKRR